MNYTETTDFQGHLTFSLIYDYVFGFCFTLTSTCHFSISYWQPYSLSRRYFNNKTFQKYKGGKECNIINNITGVFQQTTS